MLEIITIKEQERWHEIVTSFSQYDVYYLPEYVQAFQLCKEGEPILFFYQQGEKKAINVAMKRDIYKEGSFAQHIGPGEYFDLKTPYGYGGFLLQGTYEEKDLQCLDELYCQICKDNRLVCEFAKFHPVLKNADYLQNIYHTTLAGNTVGIHLESKNKIWEHMTSKNRNMIRKAQKAGVEIYWARSESIVDHFIKMYEKTMDRNQATNYYYFPKEFYYSILQDLKYHSLIFYAVYQHEVIAMAMILHAGRNLHYHLSALNKEYHFLAPNNLLLYEVACWGSENGYGVFHLGGGVGSCQDSLYRFKKSFYREDPLTFFVGEKIFDHDAYEKLCMFQGRSSTEGKFPHYRMLHL